MTTIITRASKGTPLTFSDMDTNLTNLQITGDTALSSVVTLTEQVANIQDALTKSNRSDRTARLPHVDTYSSVEFLTNKVWNAHQVFRVCYFNVPVDGTFEIKVAHGLCATSIVHLSGRLVDTLNIIPLPYASNTAQISLYADATNINTIGIKPYGSGHVDLVIEYIKA